MSSFFLSGLLHDSKLVFACLDAAAHVYISNCVFGRRAPFLSLFLVSSSVRHGQIPRLFLLLLVVEAAVAQEAE